MFKLKSISVGFDLIKDMQAGLIQSVILNRDGATTQSDRVLPFLDKDIFWRSATNGGVFAWKTFFEDQPKDTDQEPHCLFVCGYPSSSLGWRYGMKYNSGSCRQRN